MVACLATAVGAVSAGAWAQQKGEKKLSADAQRGRYLVQITGCNDCHTAGYAPSNGKIEEKLWLTGDKLGWRGPWGTTYPANLRLVAQSLTEAQWMKRARSELRPPMPWFNLRDMSDGDVRAIYRYLKHMGPAGEAAARICAARQGACAAVRAVPRAAEVTGFPLLPEEGKDYPAGSL
jgi:mono/diheme cytochrome c family protein